MNHIFKYIFSIIITATCAVTAHAQSERVTFSGNTMSIREAFAQIQDQTGYGLGYSDSMLDANKSIVLSSRVTTLDAAMKEILINTGLTYNVSQNFIAIIRENKRPQPKPVPAITPQPRQQTQPRPSQNIPNYSNTPKQTNTQPNRQTYVTITVPVDIAQPQPEHQTAYIPVETYAANNDKLPSIALKVNFLYGLATLTPNLGLEIGLGKRTSLEVFGSYNPWNRLGTRESNKKLVHWLIQPEFRYWTCERFNGHFFGAHAIASMYNVSRHEIPGMFSKDYRQEGYAVGAGISYGYHLPLLKNLAAEFNIGVGFMYLQYDRYGCVMCNKKEGTYNDVWFGPTKAGISLVWVIR